MRDQTPDTMPLIITSNLGVGKFIIICLLKKQIIINFLLTFDHIKKYQTHIINTYINYLFSFIETKVTLIYNRLSKFSIPLLSFQNECERRLNIKIKLNKI